MYQNTLTLEKALRVGNFEKLSDIEQRIITIYRSNEISTENKIKELEKIKSTATKKRMPRQNKSHLGLRNQINLCVEAIRKLERRHSIGYIE